MPFVSNRALRTERQEKGIPPQVLVDLLDLADIRFNGDRPWDIQVHDGAFYRKILMGGTLAFGETYTDGLWDCARLDELFHRLMRSDINEKFSGWFKLRLLFEFLRHSLFNLQSKRRAFQVGQQHYDIGNDVFTVMLDSGMNYSCGYWEYADNLEDAQRHKLDLICRKLQLKQGERLLEIGCGWGGLMRYAAKHYGVEVVGLTVSKEQYELAQVNCQGLPVRVELQDYREMTGQFDKVVSVGMFEHVGRKNYYTYFDTVSRLLKEDGLFLLHTIGNNTTIKTADPWIDKYIFPNGELPSANDITRTVENRFLIEDWHNFGQDYDRTLMAWWNNFDAAWPSLEAKYGRCFYRIWKYYLLSCAGFFRGRQGQLWQLVLTKRGYPKIYRSLRGASVAPLRERSAMASGQNPCHFSPSSATRTSTATFGLA